jgi:hypothetical protein
MKTTKVDRINLAYGTSRRLARKTNRLRASLARRGSGSSSEPRLVRAASIAWGFFSAKAHA